MPPKETTIEAHGVQSLAWVDDTLVDFATSHYWNRSAKTTDYPWESKGPYFGARFDAAIVSPSKRYVVIYARLGTKALVCRDGKMLREINRSFYQSDACDYPVAIAQSQDGREMLLHCPVSYNVLQAEDIETGEVIQDAFDSPEIDYFHSALTVSPDQRHLISAGWIWHPFSEPQLYDLANLPFRPVPLGKEQNYIPTYQEIVRAVFLDSDRLSFATSNSESLDPEAADPIEVGPHELVLWSISQKHVVNKMSCGMPLGELMPINSRYVVSFHSHPRLWDLEKKCLAFEWRDLPSGTAESSISGFAERIPLAKDGPNRRFAVAREGKITAVELDLS